MRPNMIPDVTPAQPEPLSDEVLHGVLPAARDFAAGGPPSREMVQILRIVSAPLIEEVLAHRGHMARIRAAVMLPNVVPLRRDP